MRISRPMRRLLERMADCEVLDALVYLAPANRASAFALESRGLIRIGLNAYGGNELRLTDFGREILK